MTQTKTNGNRSAVAEFDPFAELREDGERIIAMLMAKADDLCDAIDKDTAMGTALSEAKRHLDLAEADVIMEASFAGKDGPLGGIAKTSKEYGYALDALLGHNPQVQAIRQSVRQLEVEAANAETERKQAETRFSAIRYVAGLKTAIINSTVK